MIKLNLGCGVRLRSGFINVDNYCTLKDLKSGKPMYKNAIIEKDSKFVKADICKLPFDKSYADYIICIDVIEHFKIRNIIKGLSEIRRVLKKNGKFAIMTIDFSSLCKSFLEMEEAMKKDKCFYPDRYLDIAQHIYGNQAGEHDGEIHKIPFNTDFLAYCMDCAGFKDYKMYKIPKGKSVPLGIEGLSDIPGIMFHDMLLVTNIELK